MARRESREERLVGESLIGGGRSAARAVNTFPVWRYVLLLLVLAIGVVYALPNLYPPDYALQIKPTNDELTTPIETVERAAELLRKAAIDVKGTELQEGSGLIRVTSDADQLAAQDLLQGALNPNDRDDYLIALNLAATTPTWLADLGGKPMAYGLDLSGGIHFLLQVDMDTAIGNRLDSEAERLKTLFREAEPGIRARDRRGGDWQRDRELNIAFDRAAERDRAEEIVSDSENNFGGFEIATDDEPGTYRLIISMSDELITETEDVAVEQNLQSLRNRVNELGVSEPLVQRLGRSRIVVELPGLQDSAYARTILNKFASLEFRLSAKSDDRSFELETYDYEGRRESIQRRNIVTGEEVISARQDYDPENGQPQVSITLSGPGGDAMFRTTSENINHPMAILFIEQIPVAREVTVDGVTTEEIDLEEERRLISVATIRGAFGHNFRITGISLTEARDLALLLRAGALAAPMYIVEERTVGASLGEDNIQRGALSLAVGLALVFVFMLVYYKLFGIAANIALMANLVLIVAIMSLLGATLTLPGIAGIVLTVGMAVDANVLIFSRIREELRSRPPQQAIAAGFDRAFLTILDANITTFFVAIILLSIGSGPIKGFAITLAVGIATSMFTAIFGTRALVNLFVGGRNLKRLWI